MNGNAIDLVERYARTWTTLLQYDEDRLVLPEGTPSTGALDHESALADVDLLARHLMHKGETTDLFGRERGDGALDGILGGIEQTMFGEPLYGSAQEKAANLLYLVIKDHPFVDGNKRIGSFLFLRYTQTQRIPVTIPPEALTTLALLVAQSDPSDKDRMIRLAMAVMNPDPHAGETAGPESDNGSPQPGAPR